MTMWCSAVGGIVTLILGLLATPFAVQGQPAKNVPRIGFLSAASPAALSARTEAFRQGLRELGYVAGKNIIIEWRYAEENLDRLRELAAELVRLKVEYHYHGCTVINPCCPGSNCDDSHCHGWDRRWSPGGGGSSPP